VQHPLPKISATLTTEFVDAESAALLEHRVVGHIIDL